VALTHDGVRSVCGIAGYVQLDGAPASAAIARRMADAVAHRGPDGEGFWVDGPVALGHRRLAIIDLSDGGSQPMQTEDGRWTLTYNGELYNYAELKAELHALGVRFSSSSDTEVALKAVAKWGLEAAVKKFNGMFAFALWDAKKRELHLVRDRFGVKPIYWMRQGMTVLFGSEIKAILAHPDIEARLDLAGLREYLAFQNFYSDRTMFVGARLLPAASTLTIRVGQDQAGEPKRYYEFCFEEPSKRRATTELRHELDQLFRQAVKRQLVADVELGAYLSGGIDSGAITAVAAGELPHMRTFTCGFDLSSASGLELYFDERRDAEMMSAGCHTEHYEMVLKAGDMERVIPKLVWHLEEPRVGQCYPNFYISGLASKFNKVVLAGTGGDEIFGGYTWRYLSAYGETASELEGNLFQTWQRLFPSELADRITAPMADGMCSSSRPKEVFRSLLPRLADNSTPEDRLNAIMTFEARTFLHGLLVMEDKVAMAHSLEARVPFLDNDLVDFGCRLPMAEKLNPVPGRNGAAAQDNQVRRSRAGKHLLRQVIAPFVPVEVAAREKQGFSAPDASWFKGQSIEYVKSRIGTPRSRIYQLLDFRAVSPLLQEHFNGIRNHRLMIWSLVYLEEAFRTWQLV
jgi:asparagine synthase (glutamine-hydrolysing)